jgi:hypothetical protein
MSRRPKIIMTLVVRDADDILEANLSFHRAAGVDHFLVMDHLSSDGSRDIAEKHCRDGVAELIVQRDPGFRQSQWVTMMARKAFTEHGADWVINNDADEFWWPVDGDLRTALNAIPPDVGSARVKRHNFPPLSGNDDHFLERMIFRDPASVNALGKPLPAKACHRGDPGVVVSAGNHSAITPSRPRTSEISSIEILHFPARSRPRYVHKISSGSAALKLAPDEVGGGAWHTLAASADGASRHYDEISLNASDIAARIESGGLVRDMRLRDFMRSHCPAVLSAEGFRRS